MIRESLSVGNNSQSFVSSLISLTESGMRSKIQLINLHHMDDKVLINVEASVDAPSTISSKPAMSDKFSEALAYAKDGFAVIGTAFILSHAAQAADVTAKNDAEKATCIAVATQGTTSLRTLIEKKAAE